MYLREMSFQVAAAAAAAGDEDLGHREVSGHLTDLTSPEIH